MVVGVMKLNAAWGLPSSELLVLLVSDHPLQWFCAGCWFVVTTGLLQFYVHRMDCVQ
jgi:hypothetical protein